MKILILQLAVLSLAHGFTVTPFENQWTTIGQNLSIQCRSTEPIQACTWTTPYGETYALSHGLKTEKGRLEYFSKDNNLSCGLLINKVEAKDAGVWECSVGVVNKDSEVNHADGKGTIKLAKKPESISLDKPFDQGTADVSDDWDQKPVTCIVSNADPKPEFSWYIGDEKLTGYDVVNENEEEKSWTQTLKYSPVARHANQTLRCVVEHVALNDEDSKEAGVILRFTDVSEEYLKEIQKQDDLKESALDRHLTYIAVGIVVGLIFLIFLIMVAFKVKSKMQHPAIEIDVESNKSVTEDTADAKDANEDNKSDKEQNEEKTDETPEEEQKSKVTLKDRVASFFTFTKKQPANETLNQSEKANDEFEKVDLEKLEDGNKDEQDMTEKETEKSLKEETEKSFKEETETPLKEETEKSTSKVRNFFKIFNFGRTQKSATEEIDMKDNTEAKPDEDDDEEKQKKDEAEKEKKELEPEEKEEMKKDKIVPDEPEKKEPKNTDV